MEESDDEYELIQCEEIHIPDNESVDPLEIESFSSNSHTQTTVKIEKIDETVGTEKTKEPFLSTDSTIPFDLLPDAKKLQYIRRPTRPVRLFSFSDRKLVERFSKPDEASKSLAMRLLDIVKSVNLKRPVKVENGSVIPSFYIMTTYCEPKENQKMTRLKSSDIVNLVKDIIHMIKIGIYRQVDFIDVICDSPAIFLIKYIHMPGWDEKVNSVYVVTSEYLLPYLCKIRAAEAREAKITQGSEKSSSKKRLKEIEMKCEPGRLVDDSCSVAKKKKPEIAPRITQLSSMEIDRNMIESILSKYVDDRAVQFFLLQMRISGRKPNQFRWTDEDKTFCWKLMKEYPNEYRVLSQQYSLLSSRTLSSCANRLKFENIRK